MKPGIAFLLLASTAASAHADDKRLGNVPDPAPTAAHKSWTKVQQYFESDVYNGSDRTKYDYSGRFGALVLADELGDSLGQLGHLSVVDACFKGLTADWEAALAWGICGADVAAVDLKKVEAELDAEKVGGDDKKKALDHAKEVLDNAAKIGEAVKAAVKDDAGVGAIVALGDSARSEWSTYAGAHKDLIALVDDLQDAARSKKDRPMPDCFKKTEPAVAKIVRATKFPWDVQGDTLPFYTNMLVATTDGYMATLAYAACAVTLNKYGEALYSSLAATPPSLVKRGPRTLALAKSFDEKFKPKFGTRDRSVDHSRKQFDGGVHFGGAGQFVFITTSNQGVIGKVTKKDDVTVLGFKGDKVEACTNWKETNKVIQVNPDGSVQHEKKCMKREMVANQVGETEVPSEFTAGLAPGVEVITIFGFPVTAWKGKAYVSVLGITVKK